LLQYYYLKQNNLNVGFSKKNNFYLISNLKNNKKYLERKITKYMFIANWSLSETSIKFRNEFFDIIKNSQLILISFQEKFEKIDNLKYFKNMKKKLSNNFKVKIIYNEYYKGNIFKHQKHYFLIGKRI
jgi:hypothetical protein